MQLIISVPFPVNMVYYSFRKHCCLTQFITVFVKYWLIDCILSRLLKTTGKSWRKKTNIVIYFELSFKNQQGKKLLALTARLLMTGMDLH